MFDVQKHLINLKGKDYLQVMWRLVWFREEKPSWNVETKLVSHDSENGHAIFEAKIIDDCGIQKSSGHGSESVKDFRDYIEKAETKAVGRALAMLGYGTQFAPELDEGERIVDSPVAKPNKPTPIKKEESAEPISAAQSQFVTQKELNYIAGMIKTAGESGVDNYKSALEKRNIKSKTEIPMNEVSTIVTEILKGVGK